MINYRAIIEKLALFNFKDDINDGTWETHLNGIICTRIIKIKDSWAGECLLIDLDSGPDGLQEQLLVHRFESPLFPSEEEAKDEVKSLIEKIEPGANLLIENLKQFDDFEYKMIDEIEEQLN